MSSRLIESVVEAVEVRVAGSGTEAIYRKDGTTHQLGGKAADPALEAAVAGAALGCGAAAGERLKEGST